LQRFYPLFGQLANLAPIAAGQTVVLSAHMQDPLAKDPFKTSIQLMTTFIMISGVSILALYRYDRATAHTPRNDWVPHT
jgi:ATP/ADP translocase